MRDKKAKAIVDGSWGLGSQKRNVVLKRKHSSSNFNFLLDIISVITLKIHYREIVAKCLIFDSKFIQVHSLPLRKMYQLLTSSPVT